MKELPKALRASLTRLDGCACFGCVSVRYRVSAGVFS